MTYVIDGYNLLHRAYGGELRSGSLERAREFLIRKLAAFHDARRGECRILLVFDGSREVLAHGANIPGVHVLFSRAPRTADDVILDVCRDLDGKEELTVVTTDLGDIGYRISGLRCFHQTSEEFSRKMEEREVADVPSGASRRKGHLESPCP